MQVIVSLAATAALLSSSAHGVRVPRSVVEHNMILKELPDSGEPWQTLPNGIEAQPAANLSPLAQEHFRRLTEIDPYEKIFLDGGETQYDEYAQAWRVLGWYIDCTYAGDHRELRQLEGDDAGCKRFLLWAAYVDQEYSGNGVGEYMYYDRKSNRWNDETCAYSNSTRCVKMDCHLPDTSFSLLGFFKEPNHNDWMEQLFKHEGDCVWTDEEYQFMQEHRDMWPDGCTATGQTVTDGQETVSLYYDVMPLPYGEMTIGLYTDANCIQAYEGAVTMEDVARGMVCGGDGGDDGDALCATGKSNYNDAKTAAGYSSDGDDHDDERNMWAFVSNMDTWNSGFDIWKQCQPCKTYDLTNVVAGWNYVANANGDRYYKNGGRSLAEGEDEDAFHCNDAAGYDNVNQCMKFRTKTEMMTAKFTDVEAAAIQGTIATVQLPWFGGSSSASYFGKSMMAKSSDRLALVSAYIMLGVSAILFGASLFRWNAMRNEAAEDEDETTKKPLFTASEGVAA